MGSDEGTIKSGKPTLVFWITLIRAFLALFLGLSLLIIPEKTSRFLYNFMGMFWLMSGLVLIRREAHRQGNRLLLMGGIVAMIAGILVVTRDASRSVLSENLLVNLLGSVILLTGILHMYVGFQVGKRAMKGRTEISMVLGVFEIVLGFLILFFRSGRSPFIYYAAIAWSLVGGTLLLMDAYRQYRLRRVFDDEEMDQVQADPPVST